ncbi:MAG: hypothetical protein ACJA1C_001729 [Crocinitomicaceae bacterium]|jgi:hypothetical protein
MIREFILIFFYCFIGSLAFTQTVSANVSGKVESLGYDVVKDVEIIISKGTDTIQRIFSDKEGKFSINFDLQVGDELLLTTRHRNYFQSESAFKVQTDLTTNFFFELKLIRILMNHGPNYAIYELNETEEFSVFQADLLLDIIEGYPSICIQFYHVRNPNESNSVGRKRLKSFKEFLVKNNVPMENIIIIKGSGVLDCELHDDCRGRIDGNVLSMDGKCK